MGGLFFLAMLPLQLVASSDMSINGFLMMDGISKEVNMFLNGFALFVNPYHMVIYIAYSLFEDRPIKYTYFRGSW